MHLSAWACKARLTNKRKRFIDDECEEDLSADEESWDEDDESGEEDGEDEDEASEEDDECTFRVEKKRKDRRIADEPNSSDSESDSEHDSLCLSGTESISSTGRGEL